MTKTTTAGQTFASEMRKNLGIGTRTRRHTRKSSDLHREILEAIANATFYPGYYSEQRQTIFRAAFAAYSSYEKHIHNGRAAAEVVSYINNLSPWQFCNLLGEMVDAGISNVGEGETFFRQMRETLSAAAAEETATGKATPEIVEQLVNDVTEHLTTAAEEPTMTDPAHDSLIAQCETYAATCTNRLAELDQAGRAAFNCDYLGWQELMSAYTRAADHYRHAARYLRNGDTGAYTTTIPVATSAHDGAVYYDEEVTGVTPTPAPRRRAMILPAT